MKDTQLELVKKRLEEFTGMKIKQIVMKEDDKSMEIFFK